MAEVVGALSYALDITEGQPEGHAVRSCMIGMRLAEEIGLSESQRSSLFYALLLKDLGCSSNAAKVCYLFGADDQTVKQGFKYTDWQSVMKSLPYIIRSVAPSGTPGERINRFFEVAIRGTRGAKQLVKIRCERGAMIARDLDLPEEAVQAIRNLDEHWNGKGHPDGLRKKQIPLLARILGLAQTAEVFVSRYGMTAALDIVRNRKGTWFDPELVRAFESISGDAEFWMQVLSAEALDRIAEIEPSELVVRADEQAIDRICAAFAQVVDAKSPWTACHSEGVSEVAVGIGRTLGLPESDITSLRRAGLLHDIGKLGVSNRILDKPGRLTEAEFETLKAHPAHTHTILSRSPCFTPIADLAARHHEKLDGSGYGQGLSAAELTLPDRILCVADMYEALAAKRPYRKDMTGEEVFDILDRQAGTTICPESVEALHRFIDSSGFKPYQIAA
ncbi:MAG: HD domain-containing protein [Phycisphaerales bacterium]